MSFRISKLLPKFLRGDKDRSKGSEKEHHNSQDKKDAKCRVFLLDDTEITVFVKSTAKGHTLLEKVFNHLNLYELDYFGLRYLDQNNQSFEREWNIPLLAMPHQSQSKLHPHHVHVGIDRSLNYLTINFQKTIQHWLDLQKSLSSQLKVNQPYTFYFGVKFYAADPCKLREEITRYQFFLQVKRDIQQGRLPVNFDELSELCAYAVQSELGDFEPNRHTTGYISEFRFSPTQTEELEERVAHLHKKLVGLVPSVAEYKFLDKAKWFDMYGVDLHPVLGEGHMEYFLGLTPTGIVVYKSKAKVGNYFWPRIAKVTFKATVFMIKVRDRNNDEHTYAFESATKPGCKHLWKCCVEHHAFFRLNQLADSLKTRSRLFRSKLRQSNRMDRIKEVRSGRPQPQVLRIPSRRQPRRAPSVDGQSSTEGIYDPNNDGVTVILTPDGLSGNMTESPRSTRSAPWISHRDGGLYTSGRESPMSLRSERLKFPGHRRPASGSDTEVVYKKRYGMFSSRKSSDNESDVSSIPRRRNRREMESSGSESESNYRRVFRQRRARSAGDDILEHDTRNGRPPMAPGKENIPNGSMPSINGDTAKDRRKKRKGRSRSPGKRPPEELKEHFQFDLIETEGLTNDELQDIPYLKVETKAELYKVKYSHSRQRYRSPNRRSYGETSDQNGIILEEPTLEEVPVSASITTSTTTMTVPTSPSRSYASQQPPPTYTSPNTREIGDASPVFYKNESYAAPVLKTKSLGLSKPSTSINQPNPSQHHPASYSTSQTNYHLPLHSTATAQSSTGSTVYSSCISRENSRSRYTPSEFDHGNTPVVETEFSNNSAIQRQSEYPYSNHSNQKVEHSNVRNQRIAENNLANSQRTDHVTSLSNHRPREYNSNVSRVQRRPEYNEPLSNPPLYSTSNTSAQRATTSTTTATQQQASQPPSYSQGRIQSYQSRYANRTAWYNNNANPPNQTATMTSTSGTSRPASAYSQYINNSRIGSAASNSQSSTPYSQYRSPVAGPTLQCSKPAPPSSSNSQPHQIQSPPIPAAPSMAAHRPVYPWSHFQPVRHTPSPATHSNNTSLSSSMASTEIKARLVTANGRIEKWTEL